MRHASNSKIGSDRISPSCNPKRKQQGKGLSEQRRFSKVYISLLERYSSEKETSILAYCLMTNHVHLLVKPLKKPRFTR
ncbi:MAG: hypothetical protein E3K32_03985 [wastewater metagenome]|nr:hypothetical protein [Candidatus Loosdrechtia aerotolerans]